MKKYFKKKIKKLTTLGFTLIELLAVIVILAIIAFIATLVVINIIDKAQRNAFVTTGYNIIHTAKLYKTKKEFDGQTIDYSKIYDLVNGNDILFSEGGLTKGQLQLNDKGQIKIVIFNGKYCVYKDFEQSKLNLKKTKNVDVCDIENISEIYNEYTCEDKDNYNVTPDEYFIFDEGTKTITDYSDSGPKDVVVPCKINGIDVKKIGIEAFKSKALTSVLIADNIIEIQKDAFKDNQLPTDKAFIVGKNSDGSRNTTLVSYAGANRENITIPDKITEFGEVTFDDLNLSGKLVIGNKITIIPAHQFDGIDFSEVIIGDNVTTIGDYAFSNNLLTKIEIPLNCTSIGDNAFISKETWNDIIINYNDSFKEDRFNTRWIIIGWPDSLKPLAINTVIYEGNTAYSGIIPVDGKYKLEVWGGTGEDQTRGTDRYYGGRGGTSIGTIQLSKGTNFYVGKINGGNGEGVGSTAGKGGCSMDVRIETNDCYARVIVAGGGGGAGLAPGGTGGGLTGGGLGGTQTAGGPAGTERSSTGINGSWCSGTSAKKVGSIYSFVGGAGAGWYSGGVGPNVCCSYVYSLAGGGGSGFIWKEGASVPSGYKLTADYYLINTSTSSGTSSYKDGYARIRYIGK